MARILVVDDDALQLRLTAEAATRAGYQTVTATGGRQALDALRADPAIGVVVLDLVMPDLDGMGVIDAMRREGIGVPVIVQTQSVSLDGAMAAVRHGAVDFFVKPVTQERLAVSLRSALRQRDLERQLRAQHRLTSGLPEFGDLAARAPAMDRVHALAARAARSPLPVLIEGEAGVGKHLLARIIHAASERAGRPFVTVDCAALTEAEATQAIFGLKRSNGPDLPGRLAEANGGTLYLAELGELGEDAQARLARLVSHGEAEPVGSDRPLRYNVRLIAGTSRRLLNLCKAGHFREDLYYRLNVMPIYVPPLRERAEDVAPLAQHFLTRFAAETGRPAERLSGAALQLLRSHPFAQNLRELESLLYRAVLLAEGPELGPQDFPMVAAHKGDRHAVLTLVGAGGASSAPVHIDDPSLVQRETARREIAADRFITPEGEVAPLAEVERDLVAFALSHYGFRMSRVARALGIGRSTLYRKLRDYGLDEGLESDAA